MNTFKYIIILQNPMVTEIWHIIIKNDVYRN